MNRYDPAINSTLNQGVSVNKVLKNTYMLLSATLIWSAVLAVVSMALNPSPFVSLGTSIAAMLLLWFVLPRQTN